MMVRLWQHQGVWTGWEITIIQARNKMKACMQEGRDVISEKNR